MENLEVTQVGYMGDHFNQYKGNLRLKDRALDKYFRPSNIDLGDNTKTKNKYIAPTQEQLDKLEKANQLRIKKERMVLLISVAITLVATIVVFGFLN